MADDREVTDSRFDDDHRYDVKRNRHFFGKDGYTLTKDDKHVGDFSSRKKAVEAAEEKSGDKRP